MKTGLFNFILTQVFNHFYSYIQSEAPKTGHLNISVVINGKRKICQIKLGRRKHNLIYISIFNM